MIVFQNAGKAGPSYSSLAIENSDNAEPSVRMDMRRSSNIMLNVNQVLKLRDELSAWLGKHAMEGPKLWEGSLV